MAKKKVVEADTNKTMTALMEANNDGLDDVLAQAPYMVDVTIRGTSDILFHAWSNEAVKEKADAAKGSLAKKTDNVESYVYRDSDGLICLAGMYLKGAIKEAAKFRQDPRSPRASAIKLFNGGVIPLTNLAPMLSKQCPKGTKNWDYLGRHRVVVQRNAVTRERPAFYEGWEATIRLLVTIPQYITPKLLLDVIRDAGTFVGVGDYRPTYGRFAIVKFEEVQLTS